MKPVTGPRQILVPLAVVAVLLIGILLAMLDKRHVENVPFTSTAALDVESEGGRHNDEPSPRPSDSKPDPDEREFIRLRSRMVEQQLVAGGIDDKRVLDAMNRVPRHRFVPTHMRHLAYADSPLPIGHKQTISQPLIVAMMTQLSRPAAKARALDVGTGSGYQAAILAELVDKVYSIEILEPLANESRERLRSLGYDNIEVRCGDGYRGWPEHAPFDVIIVAAAPDHVPQPLIEQLAPEGRLLIPVGPRFMQSLLVIEKRSDGTIRRRKVSPVAFVPMTGEAQKK